MAERHLHERSERGGREGGGGVHHYVCFQIGHKLGCRGFLDVLATPLRASRLVCFDRYGCFFGLRLVIKAAGWRSSRNSMQRLRGCEAYTLYSMHSHPPCSVSITFPITVTLHAGVGTLRPSPEHEVGDPRRRHRRSLDREHEHSDGRQ